MPVNVESMFYVGADGVPWHGLGTRLDRPATAEEALKAAGLDWDVILRPVYTDDGTPIPGRFATVRSDRGVLDDRRVLGVVGAGYTPLQNREAFSFFDPIVGEGKAIYHTAGSLGRGEQVWILAKLPKDIVVKGVDVTESYLLLSNGHDGLHALRCTFTPIRVVCQNTLVAAFSGSNNVVYLRHTKHIKSRFEQAHRLLGIATRYYNDLAEMADVLASKSVKTNELEAYLKQLLPMPKDDAGEKDSTYVKNRRLEIVDLFETGKGLNMKGIARTAWSLYNAVVEWVDYVRPRRKASEDSTRSYTESILWGSGAELKAKAFDLALDLARN